MRLIRSTSSRVLSSTSRELGASVSSIKLTSSSARIAASGVRSSCDASAISRCFSSTPRSSRSSIALRVRARCPISSSVRGGAMRSCRRSMPISSAFDVIRSTGRSALRASHQPPAAVAASAAGRPSRSSSRTLLTDSSTCRSDSATTITRSRPRRRTGTTDARYLCAPSLTRHRLALALERAPHRLLGHQEAARQRLAEGSQDPPAGRHDLGGGAAVREHRAAGVAEVLDAFGAVRAGDLQRAGSDLGVDRVLQVGPQLEHQERAEAGEDDRQQGRVPGGQPYPDRQLHCGLQHEADAAYGADQAPPAEGPFELLAQVADVDVDDVGRAPRRSRPRRARAAPCGGPPRPARRARNWSSANSRGVKLDLAACARHLVCGAGRRAGPRPRSPRGARRARGGPAPAGGPAARRSRTA